MPGVFSLTDDALFSTDKPNQAAVSEILRIPKEALTSKSMPSAVLQSPEVQKESAAPTEASHQDVADTAEGVTLPTNLSETQG